MTNACTTARLLARTTTALALCAATASALANLVLNGSFENTTVPFSATTPWICPTTTPCLVSNWSLSNTNPQGNNGQMLVHPSYVGNGYLFPGGYFYSGSPQVGIAGSIGVDPDGGNFVFSDADYHNSPIEQMITGLVPNAVYMLTFYQALAQDTEPNVTTPGPVSAHWEVHFGSGVQNGAGMTANGTTNTTSAWAQQTMFFTAGATSDVLTFISVGLGDPPLIALDGVRLEQVPEPATLPLVMLAALAAAVTYRRTRWQRLQR